MKRKRMGKGNKRNFSKGANRTNKKNLVIPRGGYRL